MAETELLPCPFCGSGFVAQGASRDQISVWCRCGAQGPSVPFPEINPEPIVAIHKCFDLWNSRAPSKPPHQEEGAAGLAERLSDWRARGVSGEDADAAASALLSQASQIEALRKERDEARLCQQQIAAGSNQSATVARIIIAKNEADGRAEAAEKKIEELMNAR